jgi:hypothetical protein
VRRSPVRKRYGTIVPLIVEKYPLRFIDDQMLNGELARP